METNNSNESSAKDQRVVLPRAWKREKFLKKFVVQEDPKMVRTEAEKMRALYLKNDLKPSRKQEKKSSTKNENSSS